MTRITNTALTHWDVPLKHGFGFKGGSVDSLWHAICQIQLDNGLAGLGVSVQSILYADEAVFHAFSVADGNQLMLDTTRHALSLLEGRTFTDPPTLIQAIYDEVKAYATEASGLGSITDAFVLNALVAVDFALWQLWARREDTQSFNDLVKQYAPDLNQRADQIANIPLVSYDLDEAGIQTLLDDGVSILKIKIGSNPDGQGDAEAMCDWDIERVNSIHRLAAEVETPHTESGHPLYYLDANGRYPDKALLRRFLDGITASGALERVLVLEEPFAENAAITVDDLPVRVAGDEQVHTPEDVTRLVEELGFGAIALKPIAKTLSMSLAIYNEAMRLGVPCFCADLTVPPVMIDWNMNVAARMTPLPGMKIAAFESNGAQNYANWDELSDMHPLTAPSFLEPKRHVYSLDDNFYETCSALLDYPAYLKRLQEDPSNESQSLGFAVIGCGMVSNVHLAALKAMETAHLVGLYDPKPEYARELAEQNGCKSYATLEELLQDPDVDCVSICTPSHLHVEQTKLAIQAGKHVLVEKPMALTVEDCDACIELAQEKGVHFSVVLQRRFSPLVSQAKSIIESGELGKVHRASLYMKYYREPAYYANSKWRGTWSMDGGGALMNQGIHGVDLLLYFMGDVQSLFAIADTHVHDIEAEDSLAAVLRFKSEAIGIIEASTADWPGSPRRFELNGSDGRLILTEDSNLVVESKTQGKREFGSAKDGDTASHADPKKSDASGHQHQIEDFVSTILYGQKPLVTAQDGRAAVECIRAVYQAADTGLPVQLNQNQAL